MSHNGKTILVLGATGRQGGATVRQLLTRGWNVRALVRHTDTRSARDLQLQGVELVQGDLDQPASLRNALESVYGVFSVQTSFSEGGLEAEVRWGKAIADAALAAGISHFVYSSVGAAERNSGIGHFESKWQIEQHIRTLGLPATILRPTFFMSNLTFPIVTQSEGSMLIRFGVRADAVIQMITVEDIGAFAALAFEHPDLYLGKELELAGDELTFAQAAATIERFTGIPTRFEELPSGGEPMFEWFNTHVHQANISELRRMHPSLMTLETWLSQSNWQPPQHKE
ncbi:NmrA family transcriptional regulator [Ktedonobacter sp. SOSP1-52]|uniref:NmrA/HSCARG family protein n=1 Tax=Ktedonobacter sp. SOSP1-52 TaxID=2778366 RepID=UPI001916A4D8|nr:NmrA/HSCARG family protein [Ktedonobacter sp. SOSP1-52]GHO64128.1 NmrA family transcriptional regulator [Ktedonobacter sp. SOSP1-52]